MFRKLYSEINEKQPDLPIHTKLQEIINVLNNNNKPLSQLQIKPQNVNKILSHNYVCIEQIQSILFDSDNQLIKTMDHFTKISKNCRQALLGCQVMISNLQRWIKTFFININNKDDTYQFNSRSVCQNCKQQIEYRRIKQVFEQIEGRPNLLNKKMILEQFKDNDSDNEQQKKFIEKHLSNYNTNQYVIKSKMGQADAYISNILNQQKSKNNELNKILRDPNDSQIFQFSYGFIYKFIDQISGSLKNIMGKNYKNKIKDMIEKVQKKTMELLINEIKQIQFGQKDNLQNEKKKVDNKTKEIFEKIFQETKIKQKRYELKIQILNDQIKQLIKQRQSLKKQKKNHEILSNQNNKQKNKLIQEIQKLKIQKQSLSLLDKQKITSDVQIQTDSNFQIDDQNIKFIKTKKNHKLNKPKQNRFTITQQMNIKKKFDASEVIDDQINNQKYQKQYIAKSTNFKRIQPRKASLPTQKKMNSKYQTVTSIRSSFKQSDDINFNNTIGEVQQLDAFAKTDEGVFMKNRKFIGNNKRISMINPTITSIKQEKIQGFNQLEQQEDKYQGTQVICGSDQQDSSHILMKKATSSNYFRPSKLVPIIQQPQKLIKSSQKKKNILKRTITESSNKRNRNQIIKTEENERIYSDTFHYDMNQTRQGQNNKKLQPFYEKFKQDKKIVVHQPRISNTKKCQKLFKMPDLQLFGGFQSSFNFDKLIKKLTQVPLTQYEQYLLTKVQSHINELSRFKNEIQRDVLSFLLNPYESVTKRQQLCKELNQKQLKERLSQIFKFHKLRCQNIPCGHLSIFFDKIGLPCPSK